MLNEGETPKWQLSGYALETLTDDGILVLSRALLEEGGGSSLLVLAPTERIQTPQSRRRLHHIQSLANELDPDWATTPRELIQEDDCPMLLLEDPGRGASRPLSWSVGRPWELRALLRAGYATATAVGRLHGRGLVHRDIRPANLLVDTVENRVWLTGFGFTSKLPRERQAPAPPEAIAGTLPYMSPEQTGRMNRSIDSRSDLYALGITLHEMATGTLPFNAKTPMEWIHCHIAREPASAAGAIPEQVAAIIRKLLAKNAEDRYQTAAGLAADLKRCLGQLEATDGIEPFLLGEKDAPDRLLVPEKLYGREVAVGVLRSAFERVVASGRPELVLVSGYSGIGKSSIVSELQKVVVPAQGLFTSVRFEQHHRAIPYVIVAQACYGMIQEILGKSSAELEAWRAHLLDALGAPGQLLVGLIPELGAVIGEQPPLPELAPQEAKSRFRRVLHNLLNAFAAKHPCLVLFLDDLQWVDAGTLELIESALHVEPIRKLLVIGAYRDNEVGPEHALSASAARIREASGAVSEVVLRPLSAAEIEQLVSDALRTSRDRVATLARLVYDRTGGNPFFAIEFLTALVVEGLVQYDATLGQWVWDADRVLSRRFTDNVIELMVGKLERLPPATREALRHLACLGKVSSRDTLALLQGDGVDDAMWEAIRSGLVFHANDTYGFLHDRVQEAAYALIPAAERPGAHLAVARLLAERLPREKREETVFEVVNQYNRALSLVVAPEERKIVAELNLAAGRKAWSSAAHATAEIHFAAGRSVLTDDAWESDRDLVFELERRRAECELVVGAVSRACDRLEILWQRAHGLAERASVTCLKILLHQSVHRLEDCIHAGLEYLRECGVDWPAEPSEEDVRRKFEALWERVGDRSIEHLLDLPLMTDAGTRGTMDVLAGLLGPAYGRSPSLLVLCVVHMTELSIEQGNTDASVLAYGFLGLLLGPRTGRYKDGYRFGQLAVDLVATRGLDRFKARADVVYAMSVVPWTQHLRASRDILERAARAAIDAADVAYACYAQYLSLDARLGTGDPLEGIQKDAEEALIFAEKAGNVVAVEFIATQLALVRPLLDPTARLGWLENEAELERRHAEGVGNVLKDAQGAVWLRLRKLQARVLAGELPDALAAARKTHELLWCIPERFERAEYHFYAALAQASAGDGEAVREHHDELARWAADCPENFGCRAATVAAELARLEGRELDAQYLFERALRQAREHGFVQVEALAGERAARFYRVRGFAPIADLYLTGARDAYERWGAMAKVRQLESRFPRRPGGARESAEQPFGDLDLATVIQVSQAVSAEIVLDKLIERTLTIAVENAGAERGLLILPREDELRVEAIAIAISGKVEVTLTATEVSASQAPESILHYVARTRETVVLSDACATPGPFADDAYVRSTKVRSTLCLPLIKQTRLIGLLYLENNFMPEVFTPRRIALLELLAPQMAISIENASLHRDLQAAQEGLREALRENRLLIDAMPAHLWTGFPDGSGEYFNKVWLDYTGLSQEQASGWGWPVVLHPDDAAQAQGRWQAIRAAGAAAKLELRVRRYDGVYHWFLVHVKPLLDESGRVVRWYGANLDIEDLKRAQEDLRLSEGFLANGQRLSATGSFLWRPSSGEVRFSEELNRIFGFGPTTRLSLEDVAARIHPDDRQLAAENMERSRRGSAPDPYELRLLLPDGKLRHLQASVYQTRDLEGRPEVIGVMQDISQRRFAEEALSRVRSDLAKMTRVASLGALTAAIAHEINQPLLGIMTNAGTCLKLLAAEPPKIERALETVRRTMRDGQRAADVITRLRALFANKNAAKEQVDLNEATREVLALSRSELQRNRVVLHSELTAELPPVLGDRTQLQQVVLNLLLNASEAMLGVEDRPRQLVVRTGWERDNRLRVTVKDVGTGISPQEVEKLFEPFHTTKATGMGIGLSVSRSIVESHGGRLWAVPNGDGPGASFSFSLPPADKSRLL